MDRQISLKRFHLQLTVTKRINKKGRMYLRPFLYQIAD